MRLSRKMGQIEERSPPSSAFEDRRSLKIAIGSGYVFACFFLIGPLFGLIAIGLYLGMSPADLMEKRFFLAYPPALVLGGIQAYRCGLRVTDFLEAEGYVSFRCVLSSALRVGVTPSFLVALIAFVSAWAAHDLRGVAYWPALAFGFAISVHLAAALGVSIMIIPLMRRPKHHLPEA